MSKGQTINFSSLAATLYINHRCNDDEQLGPIFYSSIKNYVTKADNCSDPPLNTNTWHPSSAYLHEPTVGLCKELIDTAKQKACMYNANVFGYLTKSVIFPTPCIQVEKG